MPCGHHEGRFLSKQRKAIPGPLSLYITVNAVKVAVVGDPPLCARIEGRVKPVFMSDFTVYRRGTEGALLFHVLMKLLKFHLCGLQCTLHDYSHPGDDAWISCRAVPIEVRPEIGGRAATLLERREIDCTSNRER